MYLLLPANNCSFVVFCGSWHDVMLSQGDVCDIRANETTGCQLAPSQLQLLL